MNNSNNIINENSNNSNTASKAATTKQTQQVPVKRNICDGTLRTKPVLWEERPRQITMVRKVKSTCGFKVYLRDK